MIKIAEPARRKEKDSTIALINIVFLMLIFFLIAGTIVPPLDNQVTPVLSLSEENAALENTLSVRVDGKTFHAGKPVSPEEFVSEFIRDVENSTKAVRVLPDKDSNAVTLVDIVNRLQAAGAPSVRIVTERKQ